MPPHTSILTQQLLISIRLLRLLPPRTITTTRIIIRTILRRPGITSTPRPRRLRPTVRSPLLPLRPERQRTSTRRRTRTHTRRRTIIRTTGTTIHHLRLRRPHQQRRTRPWVRSWRNASRRATEYGFILPV